jgi:transposase
VNFSIFQIHAAVLNLPNGAFGSKSSPLGILQRFPRRPRSALLTKSGATESQTITALLNGAGLEYAQVGLEAGSLSQWLVNSLAEAGLPVICVETRHIKAVLKAQQVNKSDRNDARGIAQMMRVGLYKPVHVKTLASQQSAHAANRPQAATRQAA